MRQGVKKSLCLGDISAHNEGIVRILARFSRLRIDWRETVPGELAMRDDVESYLKNLDDNAFHNLIEIGAPAIPQIVAAIRSDKTHRDTEKLLDILGEIRSPESLQILNELLLDISAEKSRELWKHALTAMVLIGGPKTRELLHAAHKALPPSLSIRREYITEALDQLDEREGPAAP
jgi:hypothetical protein